MNKPKVSIIVPLHWGLKSENINQFKIDLLKFLDLKYPDYEVLIVADKKVELQTQSNKFRYIVTKSQHPTSPAEKRDFALNYIRGQICAFIDDDAYPDPNWLTRATLWFRNPDVVAVGGPGVTPPEDSFWQKVGGRIIESYLCSGGIQHRFYIEENTPPAFVDDWPAYNLLIRSKSLKKVGGFDSTFYGGEDTYVCLRLNTKGKMIFEPKAVVYHHRRAFPVPHLKQIRNVGIHRGYFFKVFPQTSRRPLYLMPTILTIGLITFVALSAKFPKTFLPSLIISFFLFWLAATISIYRHRVELRVSIIGGLGIIVTHTCYGFFFIKGIFTKKLTE